MMKRLDRIALVLLCVVTSACLSYARQETTPPKKATYALTFADSDGFSQTVEVTRSDRFHVSTRLNESDYDISGSNEWTHDRMKIMASVRRRVRSLLPGAGSLGTVRERRFEATLNLKSGDAPQSLGSSTSGENGAKPVKYEVTISVAPAPAGR